MTHAMKKNVNPLIQFRSEIDEIDDAIMTMLALRLELSEEIGRIKSLRGLAVHDSSRENQILSKIDKRPLDAKTKQCIASIYQEIFSQSRSMQ